MGRQLVLIKIFASSNSGIHKHMVERLARAKVVFFDSNPIGRIFTRFSKDLAMLDIRIVQVTTLATSTGFRTLSVFITLVIIYPYLLLVVAVAILIMLFLSRKSFVAQRECLRLDSILRGPINQTFALMVSGLVSVRSYNRLMYFQQIFLDDLDKTTNATFTFFALNRWMGQTLDLLCSLFSLGVCLFTISAKGSLSNELLAFCFQIMTDVIYFFSVTFRMYAECESNFTAAQRVYTYTQLEMEGDLELQSDSELKTSSEKWRPEGKVEFRNVTMRYRPGLEPSIRDLSIVIQPKMKVGIVGRTGAGKSSVL